MEPIALAIVVAVLVASFLLQSVSKEEEAIFIAIQLAKSGVRFPCRFIEDFYGYTLNERQRLCVREIVGCELNCVDCLNLLRGK